MSYYFKTFFIFLHKLFVFPKKKNLNFGCLKIIFKLSQNHPGFLSPILLSLSPWRLCVATPLWPSVGVKPNTSKVGDLESFGTPECLELDRRTRNTSHWGFLGVIEKVLKRRYRKWPRIGHLDICRPNYGQKKGRESNWQFDSRPLNVRNRYLPDL